jgi:hypothetical protein
LGSKPDVLVCTGWQFGGKRGILFVLAPIHVQQQSKTFQYVESDALLLTEYSDIEWGNQTKIWGHLPHKY